MTDTERKRIEAICEVANVKDIGDLSDGFHTFNGLYEQRMILFAVLVKAYRNRAWKSYRHEDGEYCFGGGWFVVGIDTPEGSYTYHYENKYWDMFDCVDLPMAKHWDGHTEADAETRLMSLPAQPEITLESAIDYLHSIGWMQNHDRILTESAQPERIKGQWERIPYSFVGGYRCSICGCKSLSNKWNFCPNCGADMRMRQEGEKK